MDNSRAQHLQMLQNTIARMADHSFAIKGMAVTISSAIIGAAVALKRPEILLVTLFPLSACWGLDGFYLRCERGFRTLYNVERTKSGAGNFSMDPHQHANGVKEYWACLCSPTLFWLYAPFILILGTLGTLLR